MRRFEGRHGEGRTNLSVGILVFPLNDESPDIARAFTAVTKDVSTTVRNRKELGQGWVRFDMEVTGVVDKNEYPQLNQFVGSVLS